MKASDIIDDLKAIYKDCVEYRSHDRHLSEADVQRWSNVCGWSRSQLFDEIAICLAVGYNTSDLSFEFCDMVVNDLAGPVTDTSGPGPQIFWEVYSAFDEGEYCHPKDSRDLSSEERYTRPLIAKIIATHASA